MSRTKTCTGPCNNRSRDVHRILGPGLLESVYEEARCVELTLRRILFARQVPLTVDYKHRRIGEARLDLLVGQRPIVELKAVESIIPVHVAQVLSYLKLGDSRLGVFHKFQCPRAAAWHQALHQ